MWQLNLSNSMFPFREEFGQSPLKHVVFCFSCLAIMVGQASVAKLLPFVPSSLGFKEVFFGIAIGLYFFFFRNNSGSAIRKFPISLVGLTLLAAITALLAFGNGDGFSDTAVFDTAFMVLVSIFVFRLIKNKIDFDIFVNTTVTICVLVFFLDLVLRLIFNMTIVTNISISRICIVGITCVVYFLNKEKFSIIHWFFLPILGFGIFENSLKMNLLSSFLLILLLLPIVFLCRGYIRVIMLIVTIALSGASSVLLGQNQSALMRYSNLIASMSDNQSSDSLSGGGSLMKKKDEEVSQKVLMLGQKAEEMCKGAVQFEYCSSNVVSIRDPSERIRMWLHAIELASTRPFTGVGRSGYQLPLFYAGDGNPRVITYNYPHNLLFEYLSMYGIIGLLCLMSAVIFAFIPFIWALRNSKEYAVFGSMAIALLLASVTGGALYDVRYIFVFSAAVSAVALLKRSEDLV